MVTGTVLAQGQSQVKTDLEPKPVLNVREVGERFGIPVVICPWWGSVRRSTLHTLNRVRVDESGTVDKMEEVGRKRHLEWLCAADGGNRKKNPEIQGGKIVLWEGQCHYDKGYKPHTHTQIIEVKDARPGAMLITIRLGNTKASLSQFLLGMDSRRPYAVRVGLRCQTINEALDWLVPKMVKTAIAQGLDVRRQGDWFFIPTSRKPVLYKDGNNYSARPYKTNALYKGAFLVYSYAQTRHRGGLVVYQSVLGLPCVAPLVKGKVKAPDHKPLFLPSWHIGIRNRSHPWRNQHQRGDD